MHKSKIKNILSLSAIERYNYMIRKVADFEEIWFVSKSKDVAQTLILNEGVESVAIWPEKEFADLVIKEQNWEKCSAQSINIYEFLEWLDQFNIEKMKVAAFPLPNLDSIEVDPLEIKRDLIEECSQYE